MAESVLAISIDGLDASAAVRRLGVQAAAEPLRAGTRAGASTLNARTERELTITLPNHTGMVTGRRIDAASGGHGVTWNDDRRRPTTVQQAAGHDGRVGLQRGERGRRLRPRSSPARPSSRLWKRSWPDAIDRSIDQAGQPRAGRAG